MKQQVKSLIGNFDDGLLEGLATIQFENVTQQVAYFHKGFLSGLSRIFRCQVSISSMFYVKKFCQYFGAKNYKSKMFGFETFWQKDISKKC